MLTRSGKGLTCNLLDVPTNLGTFIQVLRVQVEGIEGILRVIEEVV